MSLPWCCRRQCSASESCSPSARAARSDAGGTPDRARPRLHVRSAGAGLVLSAAVRRAADRGLVRAGRSAMREPRHLGASRLRTFLRVTMRSMEGVIAGIVLSFAHTVGEFGVCSWLAATSPASRAPSPSPSTTTSRRSKSRGQQHGARPAAFRSWSSSPCTAAPPIVGRGAARMTLAVDYRSAVAALPSRGAFVAPPASHPVRRLGSARPRSCAACPASAPESGGLPWATARCSTPPPDRRHRPAAAVGYVFQQWALFPH